MNENGLIILFLYLLVRINHKTLNCKRIDFTISENFTKMTEKIIYKEACANIICSDFPDLDVIRVDDVYYMVSTTMHFMPGCVILRSYNLKDWEFCSYVYDELEKTERQTLQDNHGIYGKGMWAASLRYDNGIFYVAFVANDTHKTYLYRSENIEGPWQKSEIKGFFHDLSLLFDYDKNGKRHAYLVHGNCDVRLTELEDDLSAPKKGGIDKIIIQDDREKVDLGYEGSHFYKINGKYYIFCIHKEKNQMRSEVCFYSNKIEGPYTGGQVLCADYQNWNSGAAQGGIVQTSDSSWFAILFQDHGALGRIPILIPVDFSSDFPVFLNQNGNVLQTVKVPDNRPDYVYKKLYGSDFLDDNGKLYHFWQWNHIHNPSLGYFTEINGKNCLSIKTDKIVKNIVQASNTLTQRSFGEKCSAEVTVDVSKINDGDYAGFCALEGEYSFIAITKGQDGKHKLVKAEHKISYVPWAMGVFDEDLPEIVEETDFSGSKITFKIEFDLSKENQTAVFSYYDESQKKFIVFGKASKLRYTLDHFVGVRFALFNYSTKQAGGIAVFSDFKYND